MLFLWVLPVAIIFTIIVVNATIVSVMTVIIIMIPMVVTAIIITILIPMIVIRNTSIQCLLTIIMPRLLNAVDFKACK